MPSAVATTNIFPGAAVAQSKDNVSLAGGSLLATHIANLGAITRGIVALTSLGQVTLNDWTLATGARQLSTGATYYVATSGMLSTSGTQPVGIAISPITLSVNIQSQAAASTSGSSTSASVTAQLTSLQSQINILSTKVPKIYSGTTSIANASNSGTITGLGITAFMPTRAIPVVRAPVGGLSIFASVVDGTVTQDGFSYILSSLTDSANYKLDFTMTP